MRIPAAAAVAAALLASPLRAQDAPKAKRLALGGGFTVAAPDSGRLPYAVKDDPRGRSIAFTFPANKDEMPVLMVQLVNDPGAPANGAKALEKYVREEKWTYGGQGRKGTLAGLAMHEHDLRLSFGGRSMRREVAFVEVAPHYWVEFNLICGADGYDRFAALYAELRDSLRRKR
jgi:ABC-type amino acid transport substrate-binding protein